MTEVKGGRTCQKCGAEKVETYCNICKEDTLSHVTVIVTETVKIWDHLVGRIKRIGRKDVRFKTGTFQSGDSRLTEGVDMLISTDRENDRYDQVVVDRKTGEVIHEEHVSLRDKNKKF